MHFGHNPIVKLFISKTGSKLLECIQKPVRQHAMFARSSKEMLVSRLGCPARCKEHVIFDFGEPATAERETPRVSATEVAPRFEQIFSGGYQTLRWSCGQVNRLQATHT